MRFGVFLPPMHKTGVNPTLALHRDLELVEHIDRLGYAEAWIGEHHSAGSELIASPEVFIAAAAERTRHIKLGTGVVSLPYHHPLMVANRIVQLDHLTRGRVLFGVGVLGGFTTYSSFNAETIALANQGAWGKAALYVGVTLAGCLLAGVLGWLVARP